MTKDQIKNLVSLLTVTELSSGATFLGIRGYEAKSGEIADFIVNSNFSYANAVNADMTALEALTQVQMTEIANSINFDVELIEKAKNTLYSSFEKNKDKKTASAQSLAQSRTYDKVNHTIKLRNVDGDGEEVLDHTVIYIYAMSHRKYNINSENAVYPPAPNSQKMTIAKNAIKKACNFKTVKYRNFIVDVNQLTTVKLNGETIDIV